MTIRKIFLAASALLFSVSAVAVPARPGLVKIAQPNGDSITVSIRGDERHHFYLSVDGYALARDNNDNFRYMMARDGVLTATDIIAADPHKRSPEVRQMLAGVDLDNQAAMLRAAAQLSPKALTKSRPIAPSAIRKASSQRKAVLSYEAPTAPEALDWTSFPNTGNTRALVILVEFSNRKFNAANSYSTYNDMMNKRGFNLNGANGSCLDFFEYSSNGQFSPQFDIYGPVTLSKTYDYYGANDSWGDDKYPEEMVIDACKALDSQIDFRNYDTDGDGVIDNVYVFYAGYGEADGGPSSTIWPHSWDIVDGAGKYVYLDGKLLNHYATSNEIDYETRKLAGIGVFVHEFGHVLGLPDLYATSYTSAFTPGEFDVMDHGSYNGSMHFPPSYSGYERYCMGWVKPRLLKDPCNVTLYPISSWRGYNDVRIIQTERSNEYYVLENRQQADWDSYIPGHGMLVWHIDYNYNTWNQNSCNNQSSHQYIDIVEADRNRSESTRAGDPFPGSMNVTSLTDTSNPGMQSWAGKALNTPLTDIAESSDGVITFKVKGGGEDEPIHMAGDLTLLNVETLPATEIANNEFTANWLPLDDAEYYKLDLFTVPANNPDAPLTADFSDSELPAGWSAENVDFDQRSSYAATAPSLKMGASSYIQTPYVLGNIKSLSFWYRASSSSNRIVIYSSYDGQEWDKYITINSLSTSGTKWSRLSIPDGVHQLRIIFDRVSGSGTVSIDDIAITVDDTVNYIPVDRYTGVTTAETSYHFDTLESGTTYAYRVSAHNANTHTAPSEMVLVTTTGETGVVEITTSSEGPTIAVDLYGRPVDITTAPAGVYVIRTGNQPAKKVLKR